MSDKKDSKVKKFCFTLNNYSAEEETAIIAYATKFAVFAVIGHEVGEEGTPHLQGFINRKTQTRFTAIKKVMPRAHLEVSRGSDQQNLDYCTKADKAPFIIGEPQSAGKRNDLDDACAAVQNGATLAQVAAEYPAVVVKYPRGIQTLVSLQHTNRNPNTPPTVLWLWGATGVGKTRFAYDYFEAEHIYMKDSTQWWDGYNQQHVVVIDEFRNGISLDVLLPLLDRYPMRVYCKGGSIAFNSPVIIITSEYAPDYFYFDTKLAQVMRRITQVIHVEA